MGVLLDWINGRGFVNSDHIVSAKVHIDGEVIKLYVMDVTGKDHLIRDPSDTSDYEVKLDWEVEGRRKIADLKKAILGDEPNSRIPVAKKIVRKAK